MVPVYYIGKRTLLDIMGSAVFWGALILAGIVCFMMLYIGWRSVQSGAGVEHPRDRGGHFRMDDQTDPDASGGPDSNGFLGSSRFREPDPRDRLLWFVYVATIGFTNLLGIFIMIGLLSRDIEDRRIDILLARPVSRGQIYLGKLLGGWASILVFLAAITAWTVVCMFISGMGVQWKYLGAIAVGSISPLLIASLTLLMSLWMKGMLAGLIATVATFSSSTVGVALIYLMMIEVLKLNKVAYVVYRILPPLNVIGQNAIAHLHKDLYMRMLLMTVQGNLPDKIGLYTHMWEVWVYFGVVVILGWLSLFRRQFT